MSAFQTAVLLIFGAFLIAGVVVLAVFKTDSSGGGSGIPVIIWGTLRAEDIGALIPKVIGDDKSIEIQYVEKNEDEFDTALIEALASNKGPDAILFGAEGLIRHADKILPLSYDTVDERTFRNSFVEESELYLAPEGIFAMPFSIDPLVMYWNRDLLTASNIALPPRAWDEFFGLTEKLTVRDDVLGIRQSTVSIGEYRNVAHAKEIISAMLLQAGNKIVERRVSPQGESVLLSALRSGTTGASVLSFYTDFANPAKPFYSWNRSLPNGTNMFLKGDLAFYFGFASELSALREKNPNLNFDVAPFPNHRAAKLRTTYGKMFGLAVLKSSKNLTDTYRAVLMLSTPSASAEWSLFTGLPPVHRSLLSNRPKDPFSSVFYDSALRARSWPDPDNAKTDLIFKGMVESVTGGRLGPSEAVSRASSELEAFINSREF